MTGKSMTGCAMGVELMHACKHMYVHIASTDRMYIGATCYSDKKDRMYVYAKQFVIFAYIYTFVV